MLGLLVAAFAGLASALPQAASCVTTTSEIIVPTTTYTFPSTYVTTLHATTPRDLGTFTYVTSVHSTSTLTTLTATGTSTVCAGNGSIAQNPTVTVYTASGASSLSEFASASSYGKREAEGLVRRQESACTVTYLSTTTYGATETYLPASETRTFTEYTAYTQATVTSTSYGGTTYTIATATATATVSALCGPTVNATASTTTTTQDARCAPTALVSAAGGSPGYGLSYLNNVPYGGATYQTSTTDGSQCCQLCVEAHGCDASAWDIRTNICRLEFSVSPTTGQLDCGEGALVLYDYGPDEPMAPGTGLYIGIGCGNVQYAGAKPDDGS